MASSERENILKEVKRQNLGHKPKLSRKTENSFNLPAFVFPCLYNLIYKRRGLAVCFLIFTWAVHFSNHFVSSSTFKTIVYIASFLTFLFALFSGATGNKAAYNARNYDNEEDFLKSQKFWVLPSVIGIILHIFFFPIQMTGHTNTVQMLKVAEAKDVLKQAIQKGVNEGNLLGVQTIGEDIPSYFAKYMRSYLDDTNTLKGQNGVTYTIEGKVYECGSRKFNTYHEEKTACAVVTVDLNGNEGPNEFTPMASLDKIRSLVNRSVKLQDKYVLYVYDDDVAPKEGSVEQFALERFERR